MNITRSRKLLIFLFLTFPIASVVDTYFKLFKGIEGVSYLPHIFIMGVCCFVWCKLHALENGVEVSNFHPLFCGLFAVIGIPYYAYVKFGFKKGIVLIGKAILLFVISTLAYSLISSKLEYVLQ